MPLLIVFADTETSRLKHQTVGAKIKKALFCSKFLIGVVVLNCL